MKTMTTSAFGDALAKAGKLKGRDGVIAQKSLLLENYMIVDEAGMAVDPESLDVVIKAATPEVEAMMGDDEKEKVAEAARDEVAKRFASAPKLGVSATIADASIESAKVYGRLKNLKDKKTAYRFGTWCLAAMGHARSLERCKSFGLALTKGHQEGINSQGGFLVPDEFENELITLREQYGVFRRNARVFPMSSDVKRIPKRTSTLLAYFVGEAAAGTESTQVFDSVTLVAKKLMALTTITNELNEDNVVNLGDDVAGEVAYAFALKEDDCGFNGDGTSTFGGIVGLKNALTETSQISDAQLAFGSMTVGTFSVALAKLPAWAAQRQNIKFYCNKTFYHAALERLAMSAGGVTAAELASGLREPRFFGYPVEFAQVISGTDSDNEPVCYVGDLAQGCFFGDRRAQTIAFCDSALNAFEQDEIAVRGTERFDIVCANVGNAAATGAVVKIIR